MITRREVLSAPLVFSQASRRRPNIVWISCEDTSPMLGCYGDPHAITPTLDRFSQQAIRYTHAYTVAGVCAPSRSGIITGMFPSTLGSMHMRSRVALPSHVHAFPAYLREAGYYCTNNAKTDYNFEVPKDAWDESSNKAHWKNAPKDRPFFAVFNIETTHESRIVRRGAEFEEVVRRLTPAQRQDPARLTTLPPYYPDTPVTRRDWANVYEIITAMDYQVGDRLKELEDAGLLENTIVCFWGDHGVGLPRSKRWLYESSTRAPLMIRLPGGKAGVDSQLVSFLDLAPTMLNLAGVSLPKQFQSRAFLGPNLTKPREYVYGARDRMDERYDMSRTVRDARYRYIRNYYPDKPWYQPTRTPDAGPTMREIRRLHAERSLGPIPSQWTGPGKPVEELYDTANDPHEIRNLAADPKYRATLDRLRRAHEAWQRETRDLGLIPEPVLQETAVRYSLGAAPDFPARLDRLRAANAQPTAAHQKDPDPAVRFWAVRRIKDKPALAQFLNDPAPVVRIAAARNLAPAPNAVAVLVKELQNANDFLRLHAAHALDEERVNAPGVRDALQVALKDPQDYVRRVAEHAIAQFG
ncbi:MAG: sulfatase-like hydrolase/transferase [Bryobacter sp.]|nr:sulfatase-like hydrolase/transferase [Bryobacter sp.]